MPAPNFNKEIVLQYVEAFNRGDREALRRLFTTHAVISGVLGSAGIDEALAVWEELHEAFGVTLSVEEIVCEGDRVAVRYTERGCFVAPFRGKQPTGKHYELMAMEWFVLKDGRISRRWGARDSAAMTKQIG